MWMMEEKIKLKIHETKLSLIIDGQVPEWGISIPFIYLSPSYHNFITYSYVIAS